MNETPESTNGNGHSVKQNGYNKRKHLPHLWKPGQSGNPKGRPKRPSITDLAHEYLQEVDKETGETRLRQLVRSVCIGAIKREKSPLHELLARIDPAPSGNNITINNNLRVPIMDALDELGVRRAEKLSEETNGN